MRGQFALLSYVVLFGLALLLFVGSPRGASVEKNGISIDLLENQRTTPFNGYAILNITAKKNYDFKTTDLGLSWKKFDNKNKTKGVFTSSASEVKPSLFLWENVTKMDYKITYNYSTVNQTLSNGSII